MAAEKDETTQETPTGHEIPVPTRDAVLRDLMKVAPPAKQEGEDAGRKGQP